MELKSLASYGLYPQPKGPERSFRNLAVGILVQALRDLTLTKTPSNRRSHVWQRDARKWFLSNEAHPGSLNWVCEILHIDQARLRRELRPYLEPECRERPRRRFQWPALVFTERQTLE